jgi:hypothetical protein
VTSVHQAGRGLRGRDRPGHLAMPDSGSGNRCLQRSDGFRTSPCRRRSRPSPPWTTAMPGIARRGVLVVGASATGTQLALEIHRSGRPVTIAVGEHIRAPRVYRGRDIEWWMDAAGVQDERYDAVDDINRARRVPSLQLTGSDTRAHPRSQRAKRHRRGAWSAGCPACRAARCCSLARCETSALVRSQDEPAAEHDRRVGGQQWS